MSDRWVSVQDLEANALLRTLFGVTRDDLPRIRMVMENMLSQLYAVRSPTTERVNLGEGTKPLDFSDMRSHTTSDGEIFQVKEMALPTIVAVARNLPGKHEIVLN